jgi:hypothetical protein
MHDRQRSGYTRITGGEAYRLGLVEEEGRLGRNTGVAVVNSDQFSRSTHVAGYHQESNLDI